MWNNSISGPNPEGIPFLMLPSPPEMPGGREDGVRERGVVAGHGQRDDAAAARHAARAPHAHGRGDEGGHRQLGAQPREPPGSVQGRDGNFRL